MRALTGFNFSCLALSTATLPLFSRGSWRGFLLIFFLSPNLVRSQQIDSTLFKFTFLRTDYDSSYIFTPPQDFEVNTFISTRGYNFTTNHPGEGDFINFLPTEKLNLGLGASYKGFSLSYGFTISSSVNDSTPGSTGFGFLTSLYAGQHVFDLGFHTTGGYQVIKTDTETNTQEKVYRADIRNVNILVNYLYNFNYRRFSFNAAFSSGQVQLKSAGSPQAGLFVSYFDVHANDRIVPPHFVDSATYQQVFSEANLLSIGFMAGYSFTIVLPFHCTFSLAAAPGVAANLGEAKTDVYHEIGDPLTASFKLLTRSCIAYDQGKHFFVLISSYTDRTWLRLKTEDNITLKNQATTVELLAGYRFDLWKGK